MDLIQHLPHGSPLNDHRLHFPGQETYPDPTNSTVPKDNPRRSHELAEPNHEEFTPVCEFSHPYQMSSSPNGTHFREIVSNIFGRNKSSTKLFPEWVWVWYCRRHYQRARYRTQQWPFTQCELLFQSYTMPGPFYQFYSKHPDKHFVKSGSAEDNVQFDQRPVEFDVPGEVGFMHPHEYYTTLAYGYIDENDFQDRAIQEVLGKVIEIMFLEVPHTQGREFVIFAQEADLALARLQAGDPLKYIVWPIHDRRGAK